MTPKTIARPALAVGGLLLLALLGGCRSSGLTVTLVSTPDLNSCVGDDSAPTAVSVYVYELANDINFRNVTKENFFVDGALGDEVIAATPFSLFPDRRQSIPGFKPDENTRFIGVAADMRCPEGDNWRRIYPVEALRSQKQIFVEVGRNTLRLVE